MNFVEDGGFVPPQDPPANFSQTPPNDESVKMTLIGSRRSVDRMVHLLHRHNIIAGGEWSRPIPIKNSNEVISVANRMIQIDWRSLQEDPILQRISQPVCL